MKKEQNGTQEKNQLIINNSNAESNSKKIWQTRNREQNSKSKPFFLRINNTKLI